jgi:uncharacterized Zn finger protein (UPF0148 family)
MAKKKKAVANDENVESNDVFTVTRSFARKLNMAAHGGKQYETADIFCSVTGTGTDIEVLSGKLDNICIAEVQKTIDAFDAEEAEVQAEEVKPTKKKKILDVGVKVEQEEFEEIQSFVNDLTMAKTTSDLKAAVTSIKENSKNFSSTQKEYLSAYYLKRKEAIAS